MSQALPDARADRPVICECADESAASTTSTVLPQRAGDSGDRNGATTPIRSTLESFAHGGTSCLLGQAQQKYPWRNYRANGIAGTTRISGRRWSWPCRHNRRGVP